MANEQDRTDRPLVDTEVGFEVAIGVLDDLVGHAAVRLRSERSRPDPDPDAVAEWERRRDDWVARRRSLHPRDGLAIRTILEDDAAFLRSLWAR